VDRAAAAEQSARREERQGPMAARGAGCWRGRLPAGSASL